MTKINNQSYCNTKRLGFKGNKVFIGLVFTTILLLSLPANINARLFSTRTAEKKILDDILSPPYDRRIRPGPLPNKTGPTDETQVEVNLLLRSVSKIEITEYTVQLTMREEWYDDRLVYNNKRAKISSADFPPYLTITDTSRVWSPDLFFVNEKEAHEHKLIRPNEYIRIYPDGKVLFSIRLSLVLGCTMHLQFFPMDRQKCSIIMASYGRTAEDLIFKWKLEDPIQMPNLTLPKFHMEEVKTLQVDRITNTGNYSTLRADFILRRNFSYYMTQLYIPCIMLVIVSQVSFYVDENSAPARTALGITTLLTTATTTSGINNSLPPVSYTKAIDIWNGVCLTFVFCALLEYAFVNYYMRVDKRLKKKMQEEERSYEPPETRKCCQWFTKRYPSRSKRIDIVARILFPLAFLSFNIAYWTICLTFGDRLMTDKNGN